MARKLVKQKTYDFYSDGAHGWMKVKIKELKDMGIEDKISGFSYIRGKYAYLEEDSDAGLFLKALEARGIAFKFREHISDKSSKIRSYPHYRTPTPEYEAERNALIAEVLAARNWNSQAIRKIKNSEVEDLRYWAKKYL